MRDKNKTKDQLIEELTDLRQRIAELEQAKNEETGGRSEEHLREIIDGVKDGIVILDLKGTVTTINKRVTEVAGYTEKEIIGKRLTRLKMFPPKSIVTMFTAFTHVISGQQPPPYEVEVYSKTGEKLVVEIHGSLLRKGGKKAGVVAVLRDVTERKQLEALLLRERETFVTILQHAPYGVVLLDKEGKHLYVNHAFTAITGYTLEDIPTGRDWLHKAYPDEAYRQKITALWKKDRGLGGTSREISVACKNGEMKEIEFKTTILDDGRAVVMLTDVTERKRAEDALQRHQENLEALVTERTAALQATNAQLQQEITERKQMEEELRDSEERFRALFEGAPDAIFLADPETGVLLDANPAASHLLLKQHKEIIGLHQSQLHPPDMEKYVREKFAEHIQQSRKKQIHPIESAIIRSNGSIVPVEVLAQIVRIKGKDVIQGTFRDITKRKQAEEEIRASETRFRAVFEAAQDLIFIKDRDLKFTAVNPAMERYYGVSASEIIGKKTTTFLGKKVGLRSSEEDGRVLNGEIIDTEHSFQVQGNTVIQNVVKVPMRNSAGEIIGLCGTARDITERKQAEEALRDSEERLKILFEFAPDGYYVNDLKGTFIDGNRAAEEIVGYKREELIGKNFLQLNLLPKNQILKAAAHLAQNALGKTTGPDEFTLNRKDGSQVPLEIRTYPIKIHGRTLVLGIARDITERKQAEEAMRERQQELQALMDASPVAISWADLEGNIHYINRKHHELFGYTLEEIPTIDEWRRRADQDPTQHERFANWREELIEAHKHGRSLHPREMTVTCKDGSVRYVVVEGAIVSNRSLVIYNDITERKRAEKALRESESRFRLLVEHSIDNFLLHDFDGKIMDVNQYSCDILGYTREEMLGLSVQDIDQRIVVDKHQEKWKQMIPGEPLTLEGVQRRKDGTTFPVEVRLVAFESDGRRLILSIARDITERKQTEETLRESESRFRLLVEHSKDAFVLHDFDGKIMDVNQYSCDILGYTREEMLGLSIQDIDQRIVVDKHQEKWKQMVPGEPITLEGVHIRKDGTTFPVEVRLVAFESGGRRLILGLSRDISERKRAEEMIRKLAYHDGLTGLPNRVLFDDRLNRAMARANRRQKKFVVMSLDLDHFKNVNDTHGHSVGDQLLSSVGKRLIELLRKEDTVSRMGGDEFFLLLPEVARVKDAAMIAQKVLKAFHEPFVLDDQELRITTSIGVAMYPDDGEDVTNLLRNADVALYQAKQKGRNNYQHYTQAMNPESQADE